MHMHMHHIGHIYQKDCLPRVCFEAILQIFEGPPTEALCRSHHTNWVQPGGVLLAPCQEACVTSSLSVGASLLSSICWCRGALSASFGSATPRSAPGAPRPRAPVLPRSGAVLCLRAALRSAFRLLPACSIAVLLLAENILVEHFSCLINTPHDSGAHHPQDPVKWGRDVSALPRSGKAARFLAHLERILVAVLEVHLEAGAASTACSKIQEMNLHWRVPSWEAPCSVCSPPALSEAPLGGRRLSRRSRPCLARDRPSPGGFPSVICNGASASASTCASCSLCPCLRKLYLAHLPCPMLSMLLQQQMLSQPAAWQHHVGACRKEGLTVMSYSRLS